MTLDLYDKYKIKYSAAIPLSVCDIRKPYLLLREGLPADRGSVLLFLLPYYTSAGEGGNLSMYAAGRDYHAVFAAVSESLLSELRAAMPSHRFAAFADHSPINEKLAAASAALGVIGCNSLLINPEYSSFVFIGGIYSDLDAESWGDIISGVSIPTEFFIRRCSACGACVKACPGGCITPEKDSSSEVGAVIDPDLCLSTISQKKILSKEEERKLAAAPYIWGCDVCQLVCPVTKAAIKNGTIYTPIDTFGKDVIPTMNEKTLNELISSGEFPRRAYAWRGEETIRRNINIKARGNIEDISDVILDAIIGAGRALVSAHDIESCILVKPGDDNFATMWDLQTQNRLIASLSAIVPDAVFLAEEDAGEDTDLGCIFTDTVPDEGACFVIDPIDGTTNFIHGMKLSAVSVALVRDGVTVFGCVYNPYLDECFHAVIGRGAYLRHAGADTPISVSKRTLSDALVGFGTTPYEKSHAEQTFSLVCDFFRICRDVRRGGSAALDVCYVAAGRYDVFFELALSPWDFAAAALILREAGGILTSMDGVNIATAEKSSVIASNVAAYDRAMSVIAKNRGD